MTDQIIEARYVNGKQSKYMHGYSGRINFPVDKDADKYANQLVEDIHQAISDCPHQTFVFDEVDKMPAGVFEAVVSLLDHNPMWSKIDFSKAIFIFLSNLAGVEIANKLSILMRKVSQANEILSEMSLVLFSRPIYRRVLHEKTPNCITLSVSSRQKPTIPKAPFGRVEPSRRL